MFKWLANTNSLSEAQKSYQEYFKKHTHFASVIDPEGKDVEPT